METGSGGVVGESSRELLGSDMINDARQPSWRLNLDEFRLPERESDHRHQTFNIRRLIRHKRKQRKVAEYYKKQERLLEGFNEMETIHESGGLPDALTEAELKQLAKSERLAVHISNFANLILFIAKVYASLESRSLAVIASTMDSFLDLLSGLILWFTSHAMRNPNQYRYPIGKKRMQPVGTTWSCHYVVCSLLIAEYISSAKPQGGTISYTWRKT